MDSAWEWRKTGSRIHFGRKSEDSQFRPLTEAIKESKCAKKNVDYLIEIRNKNSGDGISKPVSQGEHREMSEADRRVEEISSIIRRSVQTSLRNAQKNQGAVSGENDRANRVTSYLRTGNAKGNTDNNLRESREGRQDIGDPKRKETNPYRSLRHDGGSGIIEVFDRVLDNYSPKKDIMKVIVLVDNGVLTFLSPLYPI